MISKNSLLKPSSNINSFVILPTGSMLSDRVKGSKQSSKFSINFLIRSLSIF